MKNEPGRLRSALKWAILILIPVVVVEVTAAVGIWMLNPRLDAPILRTPALFRTHSAKIREFLASNSEGGRTIFDPELGARYRADYHRDGDHINSQGLRSEREYTATPASGVLRAAAFGDSFVYSTETTTADAWTSMVESMSPDTEILNYGVGAYGTAQALIRFRNEGLELAPDIVLIGFAPVMMARTVSVFRPFLAPGDNAIVKPRYVLVDDELALLPSPLEKISDYQRYLDRPERIVELGAHDHWYRASIYENPLYDVSPTVRLLTNVWIRLDNRYLNRNRILAGGSFNTSSEAFQVQVALLQLFAETVEAAGLPRVVVIFPSINDVRAVLDGGERSYGPLLDALDERDIDYIDLMDGFLENDSGSIDDWFMPGRHYSASGNRIVAGLIDAYLNGVRAR